MSFPLVFGSHLLLLPIPFILLFFFPLATGVFCLFQASADTHLPRTITEDMEDSTSGYHLISIPAGTM